MAKLFGQEPTQQITEDLYRFKALMEAGEIPTVEGQPRIIKKASLKTERKQADEQVRSTSEHSFPASDPPSWTPISGTAGPARGAAKEDHPN